VVLTKPGDQGLRLTRPAAEHWQAALASVGGFQALDGDERGPDASDPRTTAAAIAAQIRSVAPQLQAAGARPAPPRGRQRARGWRRRRARRRRRRPRARARPVRAADSGARAGYESVSVLTKRGALAPLRIGFWRAPERGPDAADAYAPDVLLSAVEPTAAQLLELARLAKFGPGLAYSPSRNRQCHMYAVTERRGARSLALKRVFVRCAAPQCCRGRRWRRAGLGVCCAGPAGRPPHDAAPAA
jgi:hypothetical protein